MLSGITKGSKLALGEHGVERFAAAQGLLNGLIKEGIRARGTPMAHNAWSKS